MRVETPDIAKVARCDHYWVSKHQPDFPEPIYWVDVCNLCGAVNAAGLAEQLRPADEPSPEAIARLVSASPDIRPEVLRLVPGCIKLVDAYRRTWIDNGGLREDDPLNKAIGVLTIAAGWAAAPLEGEAE